MEFYVIVYTGRGRQEQYHATSLLDALEYSRAFIAYGYRVNLCLEEGN